LIAYLKKPNHSWLPFPGKDPTIPYTNNTDLALMMQAAVYLKKLNYESYLGLALRRIKNAIRIREVPILAPLVFLVLSPLYLTRYMFNTAKRAVTHLGTGAPRRWAEVFLPTRNKQTAKSVYEKMISSKLGMVGGGCKSALDRAGEVNVHQQAMLRHFAATGTLLDASASDTVYYKYLNKYVNPTEHTGHQMAIAAHGDRVGARKLWEARTDFYVNSSAEQNKITHQATDLRKISKPPRGDAQAAMLANYRVSLDMPHSPTVIDQNASFSGSNISVSSLPASTISAVVNMPTQSGNYQEPLTIFTSELTSSDKTVLEETVRQLKTVLEQNHRTVHYLNNDPSHLTIKIAEHIPSMPVSDINYYIAANPSTPALEYSALLNHENTIDPAILKLMCEDAVLLAQPGAVIDLSNTPPAIKSAVIDSMNAAIQNTPDKQLQIIYETGAEPVLDRKPSTSFNGPGI